MNAAHESIGNSSEPHKKTGRAVAAVGRTVAKRSLLGLKHESAPATKETITEGPFAAQALHYRSPYAKAWRELRGVNINV